jgi:hypothetical protein
MVDTKKFKRLLDSIITTGGFGVRVSGPRTSFRIRMTDKDKLSLIYRITSGYTIIKDYILDTATDSLWNESLEVYKDTIIKNRFEGLLLEEDTSKVLIVNGLWKFEDDNNLLEIDKSLEDCKLELYNNYGMPSSVVKKIRNRLDIIKKLKNKQLNIKHSLDRFTVQGLAEYASEAYVFSKLVLDKNYKRVDVNPIMLDRIIMEYKTIMPSNSELRLIARSEPWRSLWSTNPDCFRIVGNEQNALIMFSKMYDMVYEHSERPPEDVIQDDDMLDGWFLSMKKKAEVEKVKSKQNVLTNRHPNAQEIFIASVDKKGRPLAQGEIDEVANMNDMRGKLIKKEIDELVKHRGVITDMDIPTVRLGVKNG